MKHAGYFMIVGGAAAFASAFYVAESDLDAAGILALLGTGTFLAGLPVSITNVSRAKRVRKFMISSDQAINIQWSLSPFEL